MMRYFWMFAIMFAVTFTVNQATDSFWWTFLAGFVTALVVIPTLEAAHRHRS